MNWKTWTGEDPGLLLRRGVSLLLVLVFTLAALWGLQGVVGGRITAWEWHQNEVRLSAVMPSADAFSAIRYTDDRADDIQAAYQGSTLLGYCVQVTVNGFCGPITLLVGVTTGGQVTGVEVLEHQETLGLDGGEEEERFLTQFEGKSGTITIGGGNSVDAVTGATVTSKSVAEGVSTALSVVAHLDVEGGESDEEGDV